MQRYVSLLFLLPSLFTLMPGGNAVAAAEAPDLIVHNGKLVTVDATFSVARAMAVKGGAIVAVGGDAEILASKGPTTTVVDLKGRTVLPGLIDSHVHASGAAMIEFDHPIPSFETIPDVLAYIRERAEQLGDGQWIEIRQVFITRLKEQRYPTRAELDAAAPRNPVLFATGPDASINTLAMKLSGIDRDFKVSDGGTGFAERDPATGEPTGILRNCTSAVKVKSVGKSPGDADQTRRLVELFRDYNRVGLTSVADRAATMGDLDRFRKIRDAGDLTIRLSASAKVGTVGALDDVRRQIRQLAEHPLRADDPMLRLIGIKVFLDGGMLTGSAYMREPWGVSTTYSITDPNYRGVLFVPKERLVPIVRAAGEAGLQFTAHSVGDGAIHTLLDAYEEVSKDLPGFRDTRPCVTHCNFLTAEAIPRMKRLGVVADLQPAWLYLDTRTLTGHFGYDRLRYFQPYKSLFDAGVTVGGGSDHMQKIGSLRSINPYNPWLGMWVTLTRKARWYDGQLHPEEAITREQAIRLYTANNAYLLFREKQAGSLEAGKLADFVVIDRDVLTCPVDDVKDTTVLATYLGGKKVYDARSE